MTFTLGFIAAAVAVIFLVDLVLLVRKGYKATISATLLEFGQRFPIVPFLIGIVFGHLFWPNLALVKEAEQRCKQEVQDVPMRTE